MNTPLLVTILSSILILVGMLGIVLPALPGIPLMYLGLVLMYIFVPSTVTMSACIVWGIVTVLMLGVDHVLPLVMTRRYGGTRAGQIGALIGLVVSLFFVNPVGFLIGMLGGAFIGELFNDPTHPQAALKSAWGTFLGFVYTTGLKLIIGLGMIGYFVWIVYRMW